VKVEGDLAAGNIDGLSSIDDADNYKPGCYPVSYEYEADYDDFGNFRLHYYKATAISEEEEDELGNRGTLTCSGNMMETGGDNTERRFHALVMARDEDEDELKISDQAVRDYKDALTSFQKDNFNSEQGCLEEDRPIFYAEPEGEEILYFGHSPNFRIPATTAGEDGEKRAVTPRDFVPKALREPAQIDYAEALFGFAKGDGDEQDASAYAGRVSVTSAHLKDDQDDIWLKNDGEPLVPQILSSPKPTCFPHYLVQEHPNDSKQLRHYDSDTPDETVIRGHKLYWHRGDVEAEQIKEQDPDYVDPETGRFKPKEEEESLQHTQMHPVGSGVDFHFRVEFENLSDAELGALCWALHPQGDPDKEYCHQLGMGKPFGMGAVELNATLHIEDRQQRYRSLFDDGRWTSVQTQASSERFEELVTRFEEDVLWKLDSKGVQFADDDKRLRDLGRIGMLLKMMEWREQAPDGTEYMDIENDDFDDRPVLPDSATVVAGNDLSPDGKVKWFGKDGYGFIEPIDGGADLFVHASNVDELGYGEKLREGEPLSYDVKKQPNKDNDSAINVVRLNP